MPKPKRLPTVRRADRQRKGSQRRWRACASHAGRIALLAPTGSELWRYERAFEARGLPIASQAGKGLFRRQEVQDLVALTRVLADGADTLAFGALMRGPIVGLTEEELLDITGGLPPREDRPEAIPQFSLATDPDHIAHPVARRALTILQDLRRRARTTTPALLIMEAVERLAVRPILSAREGDRSARAAANVEAFLERARPYGVKGIKHFARDVSRDWRAARLTTKAALTPKETPSRSLRSTVPRGSNGRW